MKISRRKFLLGSTAALTVGVLGYTWRIEPHWIEVVERPLPIRHLPTALVGKRLVQISDIHCGSIVDPLYLCKALQRLEELSPEGIVITGDLMTYDGPNRMASTARLLRHLPQTPFGTAIILGNHDYGHYWRSIAVADELTNRLQDDGHVVLRNEATNFGDIHIVGVDDLWSTRFDPVPALQSLPADQPSLVLCHNPDAADRDVWCGYRGWILCGHTHGGQCRPPFLTPPVLPVINKRYIAGEIELSDGRRMYINRGLGYLHRVRFNARPEITVHQLSIG